MPKFRVNVTKRIQVDGIAEVEADNKEEAKVFAEDMISDNSPMIEWGNEILDYFNVSSARKLNE